MSPGARGMRELLLRGQGGTQPGGLQLRHGLEAAAYSPFLSFSNGMTSCHSFLTTVSGGEGRETGTLVCKPLNRD